MSWTSKVSFPNEQARIRLAAFLTRMFIVSTDGDLCQRRVVVVFNGMQASPLVGQWFDVQLQVHLRTTMNSAVYVPLLLDATGLLSLDTATAWRQILAKILEKSFKNLRF